MAEWTVIVKVAIEKELTFERTVEADSELEAQTEAEEAITDGDILWELEKEGFPDVDYDSAAETDAIQCDGCSVLYPPDGTLVERGRKLMCPDCLAVEEEDEEEEEETL